MGNRNKQVKMNLKYSLPLLHISCCFVVVLVCVCVVYLLPLLPSLVSYDYLFCSRAHWWPPVPDCTGTRYVQSDVLPSLVRHNLAIDAAQGHPNGGRYLGRYQHWPGQNLYMGTGQIIILSSCAKPACGYRWDCQCQFRGRTCRWIQLRGQTKSVGTGEIVWLCFLRELAPGYRWGVKKNNNLGSDEAVSLSPGEFAHRYRWDCPSKVRSLGSVPGQNLFVDTGEIVCSWAKPALGCRWDCQSLFFGTSAYCTGLHTITEKKRLSVSVPRQNLLVDTGETVNFCFKAKSAHGYWWDCLGKTCSWM